MANIAFTRKLSHHAKSPELAWQGRLPGIIPASIQQHIAGALLPTHIFS